MNKDKSFSPAIGGVFGIASVIIALSFDVTAMILTPNFNYYEQMVSEFGVGPAGLFFNLGLIISGLVAIPFYISLGSALNGENVNEKIRKRAVATAIFSCITFSIIGIFPAIEDDPQAILLHGLFAFLSLGSAVIYCILFSVLMLEDQKFSNIQAYLGFIAAGLYTLFLCTWQPITEWIMIFALTPWIVLNSLALLKLY